MIYTTNYIQRAMQIVFNKQICMLIYVNQNNGEKKNCLKRVWCKWDQAPGTGDLGTRDRPQSLKVGPQDPLQTLKVGPPDPLQSLKVGPS